MRPAPADEQVLWPAARSARVAAACAWWFNRMMAKDWHAVRLAPASGQPEAGAGVLSRLDALDEPAIVVMNHASWWDPLVGLWLANRLTPRRVLSAPMELRQLRTFAFFRRLGVFGLDPDHPGAIDALTAYVQSLCAAQPRSTLWITPQGQFADVRTPVRVRPGAAAAAARLGLTRVVSVAIEYGFWTDRRPEVFLRVAQVHAPEGPARGSTATWTRTLTDAMQANADALAALVMARDAAGFDVLLGGSAKINPLYDAWLRLRGKGRAITPADRSPVRTDAPGAARA